MSTLTTKIETAGGIATTRAGKYLTFRLGREEFGIGVMQVKEIMGLLEITPVPQTPSFVRGVINLRGAVIPVVCLRSKFGMPTVEASAHASIIVVQIKGEAGTMLAGITVDSVSEVQNIASSDIEDAPDFGGGSSSMPYLLGMAKLKGSVKILLDIEAIIQASQLTAAFA